MPEADKKKKPTTGMTARNENTAPELIVLCNRDDIQRELMRVVDGRVFAGSQRLRAFLIYIVEESINGRASEIKGFTIAQDVFSRADPEDAQNSTIVRVEAGRLRRRLIEYYADEGRKNPVRIDVPKGSYVPHFRFVAVEQPELGLGKPSTPEVRTAALWKNPPVVIAGMLITVIIVAVALLTTQWMRDNSDVQAPITRASAPTPESKPSIAVLPFDDRTENGIAALMAAGLTEDIVTDLSRLSVLDVIAQSSVVYLENQNLGPQEIAETLRVSYVLRGSIRGTAANQRVTAQLYETRTGRQVWAERFDRDLNDRLTTQDELASRIVRGISAGLGDIQALRIPTRYFPSDEARVLYRQAMSFMNPPSDSGRVSLGRQAFQRAIEIDPDYASAYAGLAYSYGFTVLFGHSESPTTDLQQATNLAEQALSRDPSTGLALTTLAFVELIRGNYFDAVAISRSAVDIQPGDPYINSYHAYILAADGLATEGIAHAEHAMRLDPLAVRGPHLNILGFVNYYAGEYQHSLDAYLENKVRGGPFMAGHQAYIVAAYAALGRTDEARKLLDYLDELGENWAAGPLLHRFRRPEDAEKLFDQIRELRNQPPTMIN